MRVEDLERLYDYGHWTNERLFKAMAGLSADTFTQYIAGSYGSIQNTLVHTLSAEWGWLERSGGRKRGPKLNPADYPTVQSVEAAWNNVDGYVREFLATLKDEDLDRIVEYSIDPPVKRAMPVGELLHHGAIHSIHHRGQVSLLLRMIGVTPGNFDMLFYYAEKRGVTAI